ncbi:hypothetical protein EJ110_NYTH10058 [Nymphaea thermarum]|nr:hypothetical protein EJ110_NYTH10058 [Nymphaea thermarum]
MEPMGGHKVTNRVRNIVVRGLILGVAVLLLRFVYVFSTTSSFQDAVGLSCDAAGFCLFSASGTLNIVGMGGHQRPHSASAEHLAVDPAVRKLWTSKEWRQRIDAYSAVFQNLTQRGYLSRLSKTLVVPVGNREEAAAQQVLALKEVGVLDSIGVGKKVHRPLVVYGDPFRHLPFEDDTFDFVFAGEGVIDSMPKKVEEFAAEIGRMIRPGGIAVIHALAAKDMYSLNSFLDLFNCCKSVKSRKSGSFTEFILKKHTIRRLGAGKSAPPGGESSNKSSVCSAPEWKKGLVKRAEPLIMEEPLKPWITLKRNIKNIKYLSSMVQISYKRRYVYIDVGSRSYGSSIVGWFKKQYPKQNRTFEIFAIEADHTFHYEYGTKKGVQLLPYAAWIRNETLLFEINGGGDEDGEKGRGMGRIRTGGEDSEMAEESKEVMKVQGFDFAEWLMGAVSKKDFVVMKMDVEGTEFDLVPRLIETGAICLIDEVFLECHYNRWQRSSRERTKKYKSTYSDCMNIFTSLRENGVLVHQWW